VVIHPAPGRDLPRTAVGYRGRGDGRRDGSSFRAERFTAGRNRLDVGWIRPIRRIRAVTPHVHRRHLFGSARRPKSDRVDLHFRKCGSSWSPSLRSAVRAFAARHLGLVFAGHAEFLERELERRYQSMIDMVLAMMNPFDRVALGDPR